MRKGYGHVGCAASHPVNTGREVEPNDRTMAGHYVKAVEPRRVEGFRPGRRARCTPVGFV